MDTTAKTRAAVYTRISLDAAGERVGVERQRKDCLALAEKLGFTVDTERHLFEDNDISAYSGKCRPRFEAMVEAMQQGEFNVVVVWHVDRLYRRAQELLRLGEIARVSGVDIHAVTAGHIDLSTADGRMVAMIGAAVAEHEFEHKAERQRDANRHRRAEGKWSAYGAVPFGYTKVGEARHYTIEPREPEASMVRKAAADVLAGVSLRSISRDWNRQGVTTRRGHRWVNRVLGRMLLNPVYAALVTDPAGRVTGPGKWTPIFDVDTHNALAAFLGDPARRKNTHYERRHMLSGVAVCGICGAKLHIGYTGQGDGRAARMRYVCDEGHLGRAAEPLDELVATWVLELLTLTDIRARIAGRPDVDVDGLRAQRDTLETRRRGLVRMHTRGQINEAELTDGLEDLREQSACIERVLAELKSTTPASRLLDGPADELVDRWDASTPDVRGKVVAQLLTVTVLPALRGSTVFDPTRIEVKPKV